MLTHRSQNVRRVTPHLGKATRWQTVARIATQILPHKCGMWRNCMASYFTGIQPLVAAIVILNIAARLPHLTVMNDAEFPHDSLGFSLTGHKRNAQNQPFTCKDCHTSDITTFAPDTCQNCHIQINLPSPRPMSLRLVQTVSPVTMVSTVMAMTSTTTTSPSN